MGPIIRALTMMGLVGWAWGVFVALSEAPTSVVVSPTGLAGTWTAHDVFPLRGSDAAFSQTQNRFLDLCPFRLLCVMGANLSEID